MTANCGLFGQPDCPLTGRSGPGGRMGESVPARLPVSDQDHPLERLADLLAGLVAERLAPLLTSGTPAHREGLVDAHEIARRTGRSRWWVYEHAGELGAVRLGSGSRPRLGFWPSRADAYLQAAADLRAPLTPPPRARPRRRRHAARTSATTAELLQFARRSDRTAGVAAIAELD